MYTLSLLAVFKNESHIFKEWIEHYLLRGVEHFYLCDDGSTDDYRSVLQPYIDKGLITLFSVDVPRQDWRQIRIYDKYALPILPETKWLLVCDLDEFIYSPTITDFPKFLETQEEYAELQTNWVMFGSNGHLTQPVSVIEGFTKRAPYLHLFPCRQPARCGGRIEYGRAWGHKGFVQSKDAIEVGMHGHIVRGKKRNISWEADPDNPLFLCNHYQIQSKQLWDNVKATRGDADGWFETHERNEEMFRLKDINEIEDLRLLEQTKELRSRKAGLL